MPFARQGPRRGKALGTRLATVRSNHRRPKPIVCILYGNFWSERFIRLCMGIYQMFQNGRNMCRNVKIKITYLNVRLSLRLVRSLRTIRGRFKRLPIEVVPFLGPVHTMPDKFENATLLLRIRLPSTLIRIKRSTKTELFENALQSGTI